MKVAWGGVVRVVRVAQERAAKPIDHAAMLLEEPGGMRAGDPRLRVAGTAAWINGERRGS